MINDKKIVAIYTRVSTTDQVKEGHSLEEQEKRIKKMCEANDYQIYKVYTDAGISGKSTENRKAYQQMMSDMTLKKFNLIMAFKMDRISRTIVDFENFFNETKKYNCGVEFLCEKIDTSGASGMMFARMLGIFAQFERELIRERTLIGVESAVNKGHFAGKPPLGYINEIINGNKTKNWIINKDESKIVVEIFELCLKGKTYAQISNIMNEKYPNLISCYRIDKKTNEKKTIYRHWKDSSISVIINNKRYIGIHEHRKRLKDKDTIEIVGKIPPIISEEIFNECQENIKRNSRNYYRNKNYLFLQKLECPKCGRILACNGTRKSDGKDYLYYKCKDCGTYIREEYVEKALIDELNNLLELSLILNDNYLPVDSDIAEEFNKCKLNNKIRFAIDERIIKDKKICNCCKELNEIWNMTSYEAKCDFIYEFIDKIVINKYTKKGNKITEAKILDLKLKPNKIQKLFELKSNGILDEVFAKGQTKFSKADMKSEKDALEYIELLKKKYDIITIQPKEDYDFFWDPSFFKVINIKSTRAIEKNKSFHLYLNN